jgi:hypothetical protein
MMEIYAPVSAWVGLFLPFLFYFLFFQFLFRVLHLPHMTAVVGAETTKQCSLGMQQREKCSG